MSFSIFQNLGLTDSLNWTGIFIFLVVAFLYGLSLGRNRLVTLTLGTYFSFILTQNIPWEGLSFLGFKETPSSSIQIFIFLALILGFYFLIPHSAFRSALKLGGRGRGNWWQVFLLSILQIGLIFEAITTFLSAKVLANLNPLAKTFFVGDWQAFLWFFLPILALMFLRSKGHYDTD